MNNTYESVSIGTYNNYIDIDSFVDWYIVNEIFMTCDAGYSSVYFNKDKGEKLEIGPLWDLDLSSGNPGHVDSSLRRPDVFYVGRQDKNIWYYYLLRDTYFQEQLKMERYTIFMDCKNQ